MDIIMNYVKPELLVLSVVLYLLGVGIKQTKLIQDKFIPLILGIVGIVLAFIYVFATSVLGTTQEIFMLIFTSIVQGVLVAGLSTYINQMIKQLGEDE